MLRNVAGYISGVVRHWVALVVGLVGGGLGFVDLVRGSEQTTEHLPQGVTVIHSHPLIPLWLWLALMAGGVVCSQFQAWNDMRVERDRIRSELEDLTRSPNVKWDLVVGLAVETTPIGEVQLGLVVNNNGSHPIRWQGDYLRVLLEGRSADHQHDPKTPAGGVVGAGLSSKYRAPWITGLPQVTPTRMGTVEYSLSYAHADVTGFQYQRRHKFQVTLYRPTAPEGLWDTKTWDLSPVEIVELMPPPD